MRGGERELNLPLFINIDYLFRSPTQLLAGLFSTLFQYFFWSLKYSHEPFSRLTRLKYPSVENLIWHLASRAQVPDDSRKKS